MRHITKVKFKRRIKKWLNIVLRDTIAPILNRQDFLRFLSLPIFIFLAGQTFDREYFYDEVSSIIIMAQSFFLAFPIYFIINCFLAIFRVKPEEKNQGTWSGNAFIYHSPLNVFTAVITPSETYHFIDFTVPDVEPNTLVNFRCEIDGPQDRVKAQVAFPYQTAPVFGWDAASNNPRTGLWLGSHKKARLLATIQPNTDVSVIRVFLLSWEI